MWKILTVRSKKYTLELLMFSKSFLSCALKAALVLPAGAQDNTGVGIWSIGNVFMDAGLTPLMGAANPGEGGDLIQVGYFNGVTSSTAAASFGASEWDTFTAISGLGSANAHILTEVTPIAGPTGIFTFFVEWLATDALPSDFGFRIGLQIFDGNTVATSSGFNTVVSENWYIPPLLSRSYPAHLISRHGSSRLPGNTLDHESPGRPGTFPRPSFSCWPLRSSSTAAESPLAGPREARRPAQPGGLFSCRPPSPSRSGPPSI
jgi:hypothetical protein